MDAHDHWQKIYSTRQPTEVGWYELNPALSRELVGKAFQRGARSVVDIGGGASFLIDHLLDMGFERVAVVDIAEAAIALAKKRLGERARRVDWIVGDVTALGDIGRFDVWHDRAVFHFLLDDEARHSYVELSKRTVEPGGTAVIATFADDGPQRCSGLPVRRYSADQLAEECGPGWKRIDAERHVHRTPLGVAQNYIYSSFRRVDPHSN